MNELDTEIRITPEDIAEIRENYARVHMRERHSSFDRVVPRWRHNPWFRYVRTQTIIDQEATDRFFWGPPLPPAVEHFYTYYSSVMISQVSSPRSSGALRSRFRLHAMVKKLVRDVKNALLRQDQRYDHQFYAFAETLRDAFQIEYISRRESEKFFQLLTDADREVIRSLIEDEPLTDSQRSHIARRKKLAEANEHRICLDGTCKNNRCKAGGDTHEALTHYINGLSVDEATDIFRRGGYHAFYKTGNKYHFPDLAGTDDESAWDSYDALYARVKKDALRKAKKYDRKEVAARIDKAFADGFFTYLKPEPDYDPKNYAKPEESLVSECPLA